MAARLRPDQLDPAEIANAIAEAPEAETPPADAPEVPEKRRRGRKAGVVYPRQGQKVLATFGLYNPDGSVCEVPPGAWLKVTNVSRNLNFLTAHVYDLLMNQRKSREEIQAEIGLHAQIEIPPSAA